MDVIAAYQQVGTYRGAAEMCGVNHKTVKRIIERAAAGGKPPVRTEPTHNFDVVAELVAEKVKATRGKISAKRLLPLAKAAGYEGSARNFRRLVAEAKKTWRASDRQQGRRRPAVWVPGDMLVIDWGSEGPLHVFCAVLAWSRFRFVRFAANERAETTLAMLAECFEELGGVPKAVLADRMGCLKGGVVANKVVPTSDYVRFASHYGFRPDWCEAADPESKPQVAYCTPLGRFVGRWGSGRSSAGVAESLVRGRRVGAGRVVEDFVFIVIAVPTDKTGVMPGFDGRGGHVEERGHLGEWDQSLVTQPLLAAA
jgi:transposase